MEELAAKFLASALDVSHVGGDVAVVLTNGPADDRYLFRCRAPISFQVSDDFADAEIVLERRLFDRILSGEVNPQLEFLKGNILIRGDASKALAFSVVLSSFRRPSAS